MKCVSDNTLLKVKFVISFSYGEVWWVDTAIIRFVFMLLLLIVAKFPYENRSKAFYNIIKIQN